MTVPLSELGTEAFHVAISGSRSIVDTNVYTPAFNRAMERLALGFSDDSYWKFINDVYWLHGGAEGADALFVRLMYARHGRHYVDRNVAMARPDYAKHPKHVAPLVRNSELIEAADAFVAIWTPAEPGARKHGGTYDAIRKAAAKGIPTIVEVVS